MAKWGEGDPRWIVEDRPDHKNVNNWHWTMKDASLWSKQKLKDFLIGKQFQSSSIGSWEIKDATSLDGEASASNRKGKLIILYEWTIKCCIEGSTPEDIKDKGTLHITNFCDENSIDDIDIKCSLDKNTSDLTNMIVKESSPAIRTALQEYIALLRDEYSQGLILPSRTTDTSEPTKVPSRTSSLTKSSPSNNTASIQTAVRISTKKAKITDTFKCSIDDLYNVFVTEELVTAFTRSQATVKGHKGGRFTLLNGEITGVFLELSRPNKIVQKWRSKTWPEGHFSDVTIQLKQDDDGTSLTLTQTGIPDSDHERTKDGWKKYIFDAIKATFGYGANLF